MRLIFLILVFCLIHPISKLYSRNEKYSFIVQDDCNLVKEHEGRVAGAIGVDISKGSEGYSHCKLLWGGSGRGFMFAKGRPRALWRSKVTGNYLWARQDGKLVAANTDGSVVGVVIE
jgi:hypothetical protein